MNTLGARGYFYREIEREIRGGSISLSQSREKDNLWHPEWVVNGFDLTAVPIITTFVLGLWSD